MRSKKPAIKIYS